MIKLNRKILAAFAAAMAAAVMLVGLTSCSGETAEKLTYDENVTKLAEKNAAYIAENPEGKAETDRKKLAENGQKPYAAVLCCSDARVSPEVIFDADVGDLYVVRTLGAVAGDTEIASLEYAVEKLGVTTIIVLGHDGCGAISDALSGSTSGGASVITPYLQSSIDAAKAEETTEDKIVEKAEQYSVAATAERLRGSATLAGFEAVGKLKIVPAMYDQATGVVSFDEKSAAK